MGKKKPLICQAGSAVEAFKGSTTSGGEHLYINTTWHKMSNSIGAPSGQSHYKNFLISSSL